MTETKSIEKKRLAVLEDACQYYNSTTRNGITGECKYMPLHSKTEGCAVGRLIKDKELCARLDALAPQSGVIYVFDQLPSDLQELGEEFLSDLQDLHDNPYNWVTSGLTDSGKRRKENMIIKYCS